jgi:DNA-binding MarR family transcriptional regulator
MAPRTDLRSRHRGEPVPEQDLTRLRLALLRLARRLRQEHAGDLTPSQLSALSCIEREGPLSLRDLAEMERVQPPSISRIVGALEGEGWVERIADTDDRRVVLVSATPMARRELDRIRRERNAWLAGRIASLDERQRDAVLAALDGLEALMDDLPDDPGEAATAGSHP